VDWSQNDDHKTTVNVYSLRAKEHPMVSTPITWREVETALAKGNASLLSFEALEVLRRVKRMGDIFSPVLSLKQTLPSLPALEAATLKDFKDLHTSASGKKRRARKGT